MNFSSILQKIFSPNFTCFSFYGTDNFEIMSMKG